MRIVYSIYIDGYVPVSLGALFFILLIIGIVVSIIFLWLNKSKWIPLVVLSTILSINVFSIPQFNRMMMSYEAPGRYLEEVVQGLLKNADEMPDPGETVTIRSAVKIVEPEMQLIVKGVEPIGYIFSDLTHDEIRSRSYKPVMEITYGNGDTYAIVRDPIRIEDYRIVSQFLFNRSRYSLIYVNQ